MKGKLIVIEGTDCSGKQTQSELLLKRFSNITKFSFPNYDSPTGKIIGGPYLGKSYICEGWFPETAPNVDPKVSSLYYAADRKYNIELIEKQIARGTNVILDRYVYSNMAHQAGKLKDKTEREKMYQWLETLEFDLLNLPQADIKIFLHMPYEASLKLKQNRNEKLDELESNKEHLLAAERAYLEISQKYNFSTIECLDQNSKLKSITQINDEIYFLIEKELRK